MVSQTTSTRLYAGGELQGSPVWQALAGHQRTSFEQVAQLGAVARGLTASLLFLLLVKVRAESVGRGGQHWQG